MPIGHAMHELTVSGTADLLKGGDDRERHDRNHVDQAKQMGTSIG